MFEKIPDVYFYGPSVDPIYGPLMEMTFRGALVDANAITLETLHLFL